MTTEATNIDTATEAQLRWMVAGATRCARGCDGPCHHGVGREFVLPDAVRMPCWRQHYCGVDGIPDESLPLDHKAAGCPGYEPTRDRWEYLEAIYDTFYLKLYLVQPIELKHDVDNSRFAWLLRIFARALVDDGATLGEVRA